MAKDTRLSNKAVNTEADAFALLCNTGYIRLYDGTRPTNGDTALAGNTLLASLRFNATAFSAAVAGLLTANAITEDSSADASSVVTFCRLYESDGTTVIMDGSVGTSDANLVLSTLTITATVAVSCSSFTHTIAKTTSGS